MQCLDIRINEPEWRIIAMTGHIPARPVYGWVFEKDAYVLEGKKVVLFDFDEGEKLRRIIVYDKKGLSENDVLNRFQEPKYFQKIKIDSSGRLLAQD